MVPRGLSGTDPALSDPMMPAQLLTERTPEPAPRRDPSAHETTDPNRRGKRIMGVWGGGGISMLVASIDETKLP